MTTTLHHDVEAIAEGLKLLTDPEGIFEVRALDVPQRYRRPAKIVSGYYQHDQIDKAAEAVAALDTGSIYLTVNPPIRRLLAKSNARLKPADKGGTTPDKYIEKRRWILVDIDPDRPSGIPSTTEEHAASKQLARTIRKDLTKAGFPEPVAIDSGNGTYLLYRVDLPNEDGKLCERFLHGLSERYTVAGRMKVDTTTFNQARIMRVPGTCNRKGDEVPDMDMEHRPCVILHAPKEVQVVPCELLESIAVEIPNQRANKASVSQRNSHDEGKPAWVKGWVSKYEEKLPSHQGWRAWEDGEILVFNACPFDPSHDNASACITVGANGACAFKCHHDSCKGNNWRMLREKIEGPKQSANKVAHTTNLIVMKPKPWRNITAEQVEETIQGTALAPIVRACAAPMEPGLPIAVTLPKALCLAGCALSGPSNDTEGGNLGKLIARGHRKARFRIMTAGGQVANVWAIIAVESGGGKDVGGIVNELAWQRGYRLGDGGSAEGIADALIENGSGLITIGELQNWLDERHWQHKAASFLTGAFNCGSFNVRLSSRQGAAERDCAYCYPSIIANVQPATLVRYATTSGIDSGFMGRFLFTTAPAHYGRPTCRDMSHLIEDAADALIRYEQKSGTLQVADGYLGETFAMFRDNEAPLPSTWKRLVNEYGPRLAAMLSVDNVDGGTKVTVKPRHWDGAAIIIQWLYGHAEELLGRISDDPAVKRTETIMGRLEKYIVKYPGCTKADLSRNCGKGTTARERNEALVELIDRGRINVVEGGCYEAA